MKSEWEKIQEEVGKMAHARNLLLKIWENPENSMKFSEESSHELGNIESHGDRYPASSSAIQAWSTCRRDWPYVLVAFVFDLMKKQ